MSAWDVAKPLIDEAIDQDAHLPPSGSDAFLPCRAAVVPPDPGLHRRDHPPAPPTDRFVLAQAEPGPIGPCRCWPTCARRDVRRSGRRVRGRHRHCLEVCHRDGGAAGGPVPQAPPGPGQGEGRRAHVPDHRWHPDPDRPRQHASPTTRSGRSCCPTRQGSPVRANAVLRQSTVSVPAEGCQVRIQAANEMATFR